MKHISEEHIEQFVRYPETLSKSERDYISKELVSNPELQALALWFAEFYDELDNMESNQTSAGLIELKPIKSQKAGQTSSFRILAAMTPRLNAGSLETVATLASEEKETVARVLRNNADNSYKLHLIRREQPDETERTIVSIEPPGIDLVINESRHLTFDSSPKLEQLNWEDSKVLLRIPQLQASLSLEDPDRDLSFILEESYRKVSIRYIAENKALLIKEILQSDNDHPLSRLIVSATGAEDKLIHLTADGETSIQFTTDLRLQFFI